MNSNLILLYFSVKYAGNWDQIFDAIKNKEDIDEEFAKAYQKKMNCKMITILDSNYPENLKHICKPPFILYYYGDISLISDEYKRISIVGSREVSTYGTETTLKFSKELSKKLVIVSGMARGVDSLAHEGAIDGGGKTIAVLGSGIDVCYPSKNIQLYEKLKKNHLVISEYPPGTQPRSNNFPVRNRIVAGLSRCLLVTEGKLFSGTSITAEQMVENGGEVFCVPTRINENSLCNHLIKNGAYLVESVEEIYFLMNCQSSEPIF